LKTTTQEDAMPLILETPNPFDITLTELEAVAIEMRLELKRDGKKVDVEIAPVEVYGAGVQFWDLVHMWLPDAEFFKDTGFTIVGGVIARFMATRFRKPKEENRRRVIFVYGPDGEPICEIDVLESGETVTRAPQRKERRPPGWRTEE